ncbi:hypothetical protein QE152_g9635 [Popillia japonica]|uniref:Uncharacterized protein n=1 Tax=Popillia japonica TaxID=7064 RepID=A0AAW1LU68_POPJA
MNVECNKLDKSKIAGFSDCDQADAKAWLESGSDPGYQIMDDNDILNHVQESQDIIESDNEDEELEEMATGPHVQESQDIIESDNEDEELEEMATGPTHEQAFAALNTAMDWYEKQKDSN